MSEAGHPGHGERCAICRDGEAFGAPLAFAYQPIVDVPARSVFAHEALVRGPNGESAASVLAQVDDRNRYAFDQRCRRDAIAGAARLGMRERLSINFMPNAIYRPSACIQATLRAAHDCGFALDRIMFEITETERVHDVGHLVEIVTEYRRLGFLTALDDFGAGYSGLNLLAAFEPDIVKLDMDLSRALDRRPRSRAIVRSLVRLCDELGITVVAEGVETAGERDALLDAGITLMQGWLFARPAFDALATPAPGAWA
ncbi:MULTISPECIES: EAL domain-containing protein [Rubrivivax]|uniref:EAL domain-containing protein n=1 Tax=Rubrivivax benzoatilyticus TaxID=316997 RepID=A0ABX0I1M8_9BURK|nr:MULTISPECIES: EAL domain-containing protein [Rubrivivax]EGJ09066.1 EAL domain-containing protein [Rubrivivax benzoatilyticus JA2 = ATCC BAA-35]NHK99480.1 EAL domain-containing protein [Rubrivivax benzoatilyticus]NHL25354.1 EAL domain-containing protein [Rubrivivax benzoatilyticus]